MKLSDFYISLEESFRHYTVKHKRTGKQYKVTAMHDKSAIEKAKQQHGGTASRYTGTSSDDFEVVEGIKDIVKGLKGPGYYSLDKDNPDHPADISDKLRKKLKQKDEGKSPHKKGTKKYKKHMAAMHAGMGEEVEDNDYEKAYDFEPTPEAEAWYNSIVDHDDLDNMYNQWEEAFSQADTEDKVNVALHHVQGLLADGPLDDYNTLWQAWEQDEDIEDMLPKYQAMAKKSAGTPELPMMGEAGMGAPDYNPARGGYTDNMIGEPDDYYDAEERQEAYDDLEDALQGNYMDDYIKDGDCPACGGTGYMDGEETFTNDDGEEEESSECDGFGNYGCDEGEMTYGSGQPSWVEIIKHDESNAQRQKSRDEYPGDEEVIKQVASYMKRMDDPRMAYQQMQADFPFMGRGQRSEILGKASKIAFGEAMAMPSSKNTPAEDTVCKILGKALNKDEQEACEYSPQELYSELESINPELADTIAKLSKVVYDVKLEERVYKDVGVADVQKDARGKEFKFDKDSKQFKSGDGELADIKTKVGKDLMKKRKLAMKKSTPSYGKKPAPKKKGFIASLFNDIEG